MTLFLKLGTGFYFLPFIGAGLSEDFRMSIANGDQSISIEEKMDMSLVSGRVISKTP